MQDKLESIAKETLWNGIIRFYTENYLIFSVVSFIESKNLRFGNSYSSTENFCSVLAVIGMIASVAYPFFIFILYRELTSYIDPNKINEIISALPDKTKCTEKELKLVI